MTRENKLALVVGFGLVLFVGILISDHYSEVRRMESADLHDAVELGGGSSYAENRLMDALPQRQGAFMANAPLNESRTAERPFDASPLEGGGADALATAPRLEDHFVEEPGRSIVMGVDLPQGVVRDDLVRSGGERVFGSGAGEGGDARRGAGTEGVRTHAMKSGETLYGIAAREYGDGQAWKRLAEYNGIDDADVLVEGTRLKLPPATALGLKAPARNPSPGSSTPTSEGARSSSGTAPARTPATNPTTTGTPKKPAVTNYTVREGDTLARIASRVLGSRGRWREIYSLNRDRLADPDHVVPGMVIRVPAGT